MQSRAAPGRVTAAAGPSASSAAQQGTAKGAVAASGTAMLTAPLGLQATVLSQPSFFPSLGEDLGDIAEEGDILFPVLGDPWSRVRRGQPPCSRLTSTSTASPQQQRTREAVTMPVNLCFSTSLCVQPVLTLPRKMGALLASEVFRALLCFHNAANYSLTQAHFHVGVAQPSAPLRRALLRCTVETLPPKSHYTLVAAVPLSEASTYALAVAVDYYDPSERQRQLKWSSTFKTEQPIMEVQPRFLRYVRPTWTSAEDQPDGSDNDNESELHSSTSSRAYALYQLSVGLKNMSSVPLCLADSKLVLPSLTHHRGAAVFREVVASGGRVESAKLQNCCSTSSTAAEESRVPAPVLLMPGDTHLLLFTVGILLEELRHATVVHGRGGLMTRRLSPRLASLGYVQWTWCRANGETGTARSAQLRVKELLAEAEVELRVTRVIAESAAHPSKRPPSSSTTTLEDGDFAAADPHYHALHKQTPPAPLLAGSPVTAHFKVVNHSNVHRYDVAVKVRVERLAPQWLYAGPTVRLLGLLESASSLTFSLTLLPWQAGWRSISRDAIELVDARTSQAVLWPPSATVLLQSVSGESDVVLGKAASVSGDKADAHEDATLAATAPAIAAVAMKALPAADADTLCDDPPAIFSGKFAVDPAAPLGTATAAATAGGGGHFSDHAYRGAQHRASSLSLSNEGATDRTATSSAVDGASRPAPATAAAVVGAPSQRRALSPLSCPVHHRSHSSTSSRHDLGSVVEEFLQKATYDADVPPGLLRFLQIQRNHQLQQQQAQQYSQLHPRAHSPSVPTPSVNSVRNGVQRTPPPQSWAVPSRGLDSATSRKAATAPMAANSNDNDALFHDYSSSGTVGRQFCWLTEAAPPESPSSVAEEDEKKGKALTASGGGGSSSSRAHARPRPTTATATVKQLEEHIFQRCRDSSHAMAAPRGNSQDATERYSLSASALQRRYRTITDFCQGVRGGDGRGDGTTACFNSAASLTRLQRAYQPLSSTAAVSGSHSPASSGFLGSRPCSQPEGVPRVSAAPVYEAAGPASSASLIPSPPSLMPSVLRGITTSASARFTVSGARRPPHVVDDEDWKSRSCAPPAPLLQLSLAAPRASSRLSVSARLFSGAATANTTILSSASITDVSCANLPSSVAATCGMLAPTPPSADWESFGSLGMSSPEARAIIAAVSASGRMSSYGEMEPSLTAGVTWIGQISSHAASVTSPTTGTFTSTTNYCCSGASNSMTV
ncbi:hypothetical protein CGC20_9390 [Leishmania donovani]|uniref:Trafficking protein particle complex subunit 13 N-terminal domain-containing protein n=1 Tax=Leishmania donovani TaxID=5661 RepID=A0A504X7B5_LEIDO|nr:hypothetical protein CGC20_9390 [Leishmania donovani]